MTGAALREHFGGLVVSLHVINSPLERSPLSRITMSTQHIEENLLDQYAMGALPGESLAAVEEHLLICSFCQSRLVEMDGFLALFRAAATDVDARPKPRSISVLAFPKGFWFGAAAALTALLIFLATGDTHKGKLPPAMLLMQSLRGPEAPAEMASARPCLLVFDVVVGADRPDYEIEIVDAFGNEVLKKGAEVRDGRLAVLVERLVPGSYWVRVYRTLAGRELMAEYSLRAE